MNANRKKIEEKIEHVMNILDSTGTNADYYKLLFAKMSDAQFITFFRRILPIRFHTRPFIIEPKMNEITKALDYIKVPLLEKVALPYLYTNIDGEPVWTHEAMVIYIHIKKMKQFITKKNSTPTGNSNRDMKSGLLIAADKGAQTSDREMESLMVMGLDHTMKELSTWRADYMNAKSVADQTIMATGMLSEKDIPISDTDSIAKNAFNAYMVASLLNTNVLNVDYMLPKTIANKKARVTRER